MRLAYSCWLRGLMALGLALLIAAPTTAQTVSLDPTFGTEGRSVYTFQGTQNAAYGVALQPNGRAVLAGTANGIFVVARINADGSLHSSFGDNGVRGVSVGDGFAVHVLPGGGILAAGRSASRFLVARLSANGALDTAFGTNGLVEINVGGTASIGYELAVAEDGRIALAGTIFQNGTTRAAIVLLNSNGSRVSSFGSNGVFTFDAGAGQAEFRAVTFRPDGRLVVGGYLRPEGVDQPVRPLVAQLSHAGTLDATLPVNPALTGVIFDLENAADGKLLAAGSLNGDFGVLRFTAEGAADPAFGAGAPASGDGTVRIGAPTRFEEARAVLPLSDGRIAVVGYARTLQEGVQLALTPADLAIARLNADGSRDTSLDPQGITLLNQSGGDFLAFDASLTADQNVMVVGLFGDLSAQTSQMAAVRIRGLGTTSSEDGAGVLALEMTVFPNPAHGPATLALRLPEAADVRVVVYDLLGREVARVHEGYLAAGSAHHLALPGEALPAGVYVLRASAGARTLTQRFTVVR